MESEGRGQVENWNREYKLQMQCQEMQSVQPEWSTNRILLTKPGAYVASEAPKRPKFFVFQATEPRERPVPVGFHVSHHFFSVCPDTHSAVVSQIVPGLTLDD